MSIYCKVNVKCVISCGSAVAVFGSALGGVFRPRGPFDRSRVERAIGRSSIDANARSTNVRWRRRGRPIAAASRDASDARAGGARARGRAGVADRFGAVRFAFARGSVRFGSVRPRDGLID